MQIHLTPEYVEALQVELQSVMETSPTDHYSNRLWLAWQNSATGLPAHKAQPRGVTQMEIKLHNTIRMVDFALVPCY